LALINIKDTRLEIANLISVLKLASKPNKQYKDIDIFSSNILVEYEETQKKINSIKIQMNAIMNTMDQLIDNSEYLSDSLVRLLYPNQFSLTLIHKIQNDIPYIKGRVYWNNKQREVQIGTIQNVLNQLKHCIDKKLLNPINGLTNKNINWAYIKSNQDVEKGIQFLGKLKFKQYILKHFTFPPNINLHKLESLQTDYENIESEISPILNCNEDNWYSNWRDNNL